MARDHHFQINRERWLWRYTRLRGMAAGWAYVRSPGANPACQQKILIEEKLSGRSRLETEIHEFLHAANPNLSEDAVTLQGRELSRILWTLNYRIKEE